MSKNSRGTITDADATFIIDSLTREITTTSKKNRLLQGDHKSERFTFKMDRYIEGHDMLECKDNVFVHFRNKSSSGKDVGEYTYRVNDLAEDPTTANLPAADQKLLFSWLVESNSTEYPGSLSFLITFAKSDEVNGGYSYRWSTMINNTTTIAVGMDNGQNTSDTYLPNFIEELKDDVFDNAEVWFEDLMVKGGDAAVLDENGVLDFQYVKNKNDEEPSIELGLSFPEDLEDKTITIKQLAGVTGVDWGSSIVSEEISAPAATTGYQKLTVHYLAETLNPTIKIYGPTSAEMMTFEYKCKDYIISAKFGSKIHTVGQLGGLKNLTTVELGENVGHYYLYGKQSMIVASGNVACVTLKSITPATFNGSENPEFNPFENNNADLKVMVPAESYEAYKTAWAGRNIPLVSYALTDQLEGLASEEYVEGKVAGLASKTYVDEQDATTLSNAKVFAQAEAQGVKTYVDEQLSNFTPTEGGVTEEYVETELTALHDWVVEYTVGYASREYVDCKVQGLATEVYVDSQIGSAVSEMVQYVDGKFEEPSIISATNISPDKVEYIYKKTLDGVPYLDGMWMKDNSLYTASAAFKRTDFIEVEPNKEYTLCVYYKDTATRGSGSDGKIFDADKNIIADISEFGDAEMHILKITMPENARYIQLNVNLDPNMDDNLSKYGICPSAMYYQCTKDTKSLDWLEIKSSNLSESAYDGIIEQVKEEVNKEINEEKEKEEATIGKYKYGDSLNKPFEFTGKTIVAFGDSITQGYTSPNLEVKPDKCYIKLFADKFDMSLVNKGVGGSCLADTDGNAYTIYKMVTGYTVQKDFVIISGGTNDFNQGKPLGEFDSTDVTTVYGALRGMCEHLKTNLPNSTVIFITPIPVTKDFPNAILPLNAYRNAIYEIATLYGFNVVDGSDLGMPTESGEWANEMVANGDGCHPTEAGHALYFRNLCAKLSGGGADQLVGDINSILDSINGEVV